MDLLATDSEAATNANSAEFCFSWNYKISWRSTFLIQPGLESNEPLLHQSKCVGWWTPEVYSCQRTDTSFSQTVPWLAALVRLSERRINRIDLVYFDQSVSHCSPSPTSIQSSDGLFLGCLLAVSQVLLLLAVIKFTISTNKVKVEILGSTS